MSTVHRWALDENVRVLGSARLSITDATTSYFDFGTPDNLNLAALTTYHPGDRICAVITTDSDGTTDTITAVFLDAPDSSGSIGSTGAAVVSGTLLMGSGDKQAIYSVQVRDGKPWLKIGVTESGATDTIACHCTVLAIPSNV